MNYALPAFHFSLPKYLTQELEQAVQKRAMSDVSYHEALVIMKFKKIATHHDEICESLFQTIVNDNNHRLYKLLMNLRNRRGEERRRQTLCDKRDNNFAWNNFSPKFTFL